ncbi:MAG: XRE family transcriptional regulator [Planctomycetota bacterium]|nr:MAG: XRE family transcriptional regulator [Planctomycetota bacterium]
MTEKKSKECVAFGESVRELRLERGLSQDDFAAAAGIHRTYVGGVERGERNPTLTSIARIASALKISPAELLALSMSRMKANLRK